MRLGVLRVFVVTVGFFSACDRRLPEADLHPIANQNVLLITIDTLRADALSCYGGPAATPALDRLAAEGVRFSFAHDTTLEDVTAAATIFADVIETLASTR